MLLTLIQCFLLHFHNLRCCCWLESFISVLGIFAWQPKNKSAQSFFDEVQPPDLLLGTYGPKWRRNILHGIGGGRKGGRVGRFTPLRKLPTSHSATPSTPAKEPATPSLASLATMWPTCKMYSVEVVDLRGHLRRGFHSKSFSQCSPLRPYSCPLCFAS